MNLTPKEITKQVGDFWKKQNKKMRIVLPVSLAGIIVAAVVIAAALNNKSYTVLYTGLSSSEAGEILAALDEMSVVTRVKNDNTILVPENDEARLKMELSAQGYPKSSLNYNLFSANTGFMTTDYEKRQYLVFQLQDRLQEAIETLQGVDTAIVTISLPESSAYVISANKTPATASVVLVVRRGAELSAKQIAGIEQLVAKSIPGLETGNVAIVDGNGALLNSGDEEGMAASTRLELETGIAKTIENNVLKLLLPVYGQDALRVVANASIEISQRFSEETTYSPVVGDSGIISSQGLTQESQNGGTVAGGVPGTASNTGVTTYPEADAGASGQSASSSSETNYLVNQMKEQMEKKGYEIKDISVAVLIGDTSLSPDETEKYREMIAYASGIKAEKVSVFAAEFSAQKSTSPVQQTPAPIYSIEQKDVPYLIGLCAFLLVLILFIIIMKSRRKRRNAAATNDEDELGLIGNLGTNPAMMPGQIVLNETRELGLKRQIKDFSSSSPDVVAQLLRTWIKEEEIKNE